MNIGILGSGDVARTLGTALLAKGHAVTLGSRDPDKLAAWTKEGGEAARAGTFADVARFGELVFLCTHGVGTLDALALAGASNLSGKVVVDVTNPLDFSQGVPPRFAATLGDSLGERIQRALPGARVVKAFNTVNRTTMVDPRLEEGVPTLTLCGDDPVAKAQVTALAQAFGWDVVDTGGIDMAYWNEAMAMLWVLLAFKNDSWGHAFKLLRR